MDIDNISEEDLISVLGDIGLESTSAKVDASTVQNVLEDIQDKNEPREIKKCDRNTSNSMSISSDSIDSIAQLLKELLNNKSIEITIKIKD